MIANPPSSFARSETLGIGEKVVRPCTWTAEQVIHEHATRVYNLARRLLGNETDAEDVTQEVLLQVVRKLDTYRGDAELTTWLHRVTVNASLVYRQQRARRSERQVSTAPEQVLEEGRHLRPRRSCPEGPEEQVMRREMQRLINRAVAGLPAKYRDVYVLADVEGLANREIGRLLGLGVPAVKSRLHRARLLMREALAPHMDGP